MLSEFQGGSEGCKELFVIMVLEFQLIQWMGSQNREYANTPTWGKVQKIRCKLVHCYLPLRKKLTYSKDYIDEFREGFTIWTSLVAQMVKDLPAVWETWVQSLGQKDPLQKRMASYSSILARRIPGTEESDGL